MPRYVVEIPCECKARIEVEARDAEQATQFASDQINASHVVSVDATEPQRACADLVDEAQCQLNQVNVLNHAYALGAVGVEALITNIDALRLRIGRG